jgi:Ca2+-binding RTX toxin-like protein
MRGENGNDKYYGSSGDDSLSEHFGITVKPSGDGYTGIDVMFGGGGTDLLEAARSNDELHGGPNPGPSQEELIDDTGNDELYGEAGPDRLVGQEGSDLMSGGRGNDFIAASSVETVNTPDTVKCGRGADEVIANNNDIVGASCEAVTRVANP